MTRLSEAEVAAARNIAAMLVGLAPHAAAKGFSQAANAMAKRLLDAGWDLPDVVDHCVAFIARIGGELATASQPPAHVQ